MSTIPHRTVYSSFLCSHMVLFFCGGGVVSYIFLCFGEFLEVRDNVLLIYYLFSIVGKIFQLVGK